MAVRSFNFNAGPAAMPVSVLESLQRDIVDYQGRGLSVLEMSHRSADFIEIAQKAEADLRSLIAIPDRYSVLFMQGGASSQFALTVSNLDTAGQVAFANTGYWSAKARSVAALSTGVREVVSVSREPYLRVPDIDQWLDAGKSSYLHVTDNETIDGVQLGELPVSPVPLVVDMSSSILSRPVDIERYGVIYAGAQKNIGPAGITVVIVRDDLIERSAHRKHLAPVFSYAAMNDAGSMLNTPPTFAWYAAGLVFQWLLDEGGLEAISKRNERQAARVYAAIDESEVYSNNVHPDNRSLMNIPFQLARPQWQDAFLKGSVKRGLIGLKGHKSVGGLRASLYNAVTDEAVDALVEYLNEFARDPQP
ncbi:MAG: 3-phosphoserine/phosphohydroxythreonine transaminase [Granulosicoccus sp.]